MHFLHRRFQQWHINKIGPQKEKSQCLIKGKKNSPILVILLCMKTSMVYIADLPILQLFQGVLFLRFIQLKRIEKWDQIRTRARPRWLLTGGGRIPFSSSEWTVKNKNLIL